MRKSDRFEFYYKNDHHITLFNETFALNGSYSLLDVTKKLSKTSNKNKYTPFKYNCQYHTYKVLNMLIKNKKLINKFKVKNPFMDMLDDWLFNTEKYDGGKKVEAVGGAVTSR